MHCTAQTTAVNLVCFFGLQKGGHEVGVVVPRQCCRSENGAQNESKYLHTVRHELRKGKRVKSGLWLARILGQ
jgi:hypothetical protein